MDDLRVNATVTLPARELSFRAVRSGGPGGQNVNKVASKVDLRFDLAGSAALTGTQKTRLRALAKSRLDPDGAIQIVAEDTRDQQQNLELARERLAALVRAALVVPKRRKPTKPTRGSRERRLAEKKRTSDKKRDRQFTGD